MSLPRDIASDAGPCGTGQLSFASTRRLLILLAAVSLVVAWLGMTTLSRHDPWYDNTEVNVHNMVAALAINSDVVPGRSDQPGFPSKYLLALDYRTRHYLGVLPVWNLKKFGDKPDPVSEMPRLLQIGRVHSQVLVILFILSAAGLVFSVTCSPEAALLALILMASGSGLLFHGLVNRPELLCAWCGIVLAPLCIWRAAAGSMSGRPAWFFLAGLTLGVAILTKLPGLYYFAACYAWCWLAAGISAPVPGQTRLPSWLLPVASSAVFFWLLVRLAKVPDALMAVTLTRLRLAAALVGVLPLLALLPGRGRIGSFLLQRGLELAQLGAGVLGAIVLGYGALCAVMTEPHAAEYLARLVQFVAYPDPQIKYLLDVTSGAGHEFLLFVRESPFLFLGAGVVTTVVSLNRAVAPSLKAFIALLFLNAVALPGLLAHPHFAEHFSVFAQVPLLLVWALGLFALGVWRPRSPAMPVMHWAAPAVIAGATVLLATGYLRLEAKQRAYRSETKPPLTPLTLTFLYDHDAHPLRYRQIMQEHYPTREQFTDALERYLADPAHRY